MQEILSTYKHAYVPLNACGHYSYFFLFDESDILGSFKHFAHSYLLHGFLFFYIYMMFKLHMYATEYVCHNHEQSCISGTSLVKDLARLGGTLSFRNINIILQRHRT